MTHPQLQQTDLDRIASGIGRVTFQIQASLEGFVRAMASAHRAVRSVRADLEGKHELADVIRTEPGRAIVREGMPDVYHWLRECRCYDTAHPDPVLCAYGQVAVQRVFLDEDPASRLSAIGDGR